MTVRLNKRKLEQLIRTTPTRADQLVRAAATEMVGDIKLSFNTSPPGETYVRRNPKTGETVTHVASQEGYPPNVDTGTLMGSIKWTPAGPMKVFIHDGVIYGLMLEIGTDNMGPRPFITPVFEAWRQGKFVQFARQFGVFI